MEPIIKKRIIVISATGDRLSPVSLKNYLGKRPGVASVLVDAKKGTVEVEYDLRKINFETIEKILVERGFSLSMKITERFKRGMAKFTEQNELDNLSAKPTSCCSDPDEKGCNLHK